MSAAANPSSLFGRLSKIATAAIGAIALAACATVTPYGPAGPGGEGYADQRLESNKYRIVFEGNSQTNLTTIENYVLYRAAEVTVANGGDYFIVVDQNTESLSTFRSTGTSFGGGGFGRRGFFYGGGFGRGGFGSSTSTTRERRSYTVGAIIEVHRGDKPRGNGSAYDAQQVLNNLRPSVTFADAS